MFGTGILRNPRKTGLMDHATRHPAMAHAIAGGVGRSSTSPTRRPDPQWINRILHACYNRWSCPRWNRSDPRTPAGRRAVPEQAGPARLDLPDPVPHPRAIQ